MRRWAFFLLSLLVILLSQQALPLTAHHSLRVDYDVTKPLSLTGKVTKIEWENFYIHFYIDVIDEETRKVVNWVLELSASAEIEKYE